MHESWKDSMEELAFAAIAWLLAWTSIFYLLVWLSPYWFNHLPQSIKSHENVVHWNVVQVSSCIHSIFISAISVPILLQLAFAPAEVQFPDARGVQPWCQAPPDRHEMVAWNATFVWIAMAGMAFTAHIISDVFTSVVHRIATVQQIVHHVAFIIAGCIIRGSCLLPFSSAVLMSMEVSTPFLNFLMLFRHRGDRYSWAVNISQVCFIVLFLIFRIGLNSYGTILMWLNRERIAQLNVPSWQVDFLLVAITVGAVIQFYFLWQILSGLAQRKPTMHQELVDKELELGSAASTSTPQSTTTITSERERTGTC
jgi:hypothetical protein